jgi:hypothetical protein
LSATFTKTKVLITVMTYPHPSEAHQELVCTAGITEQNEWVRLYPIDYRYRPKNQQFHKYQWIEIGLASHASGNDARSESRKPDLESIRLLGEPLSVKNNWQARREIVDRMPHRTRLELEALYDSHKISLGIVRPSEVVDLKVEKVEKNWKPQWQATLNQFTLFSGPPKNLEKLPFKFSYVFRCPDSGNKLHSAMIEDWELGVLYRKEFERFGDEDAAVRSIRTKFFDELCHTSRDTRFFMGTVFPYNSWVVIGVFWPQRETQTSLVLT